MSSPQTMAVVRNTFSDATTIRGGWELLWSTQRQKAELTVETQWSKLCTSGRISAVKSKSIGFGTFCNQGLFPATRGWISSSVCKMLLHVGDAMAEWWNHHAAGGFVFFTFARCSACFSSSLAMPQPIESWCFWGLLIWVTFWVTVPSWQVEVSRPPPTIGCRCIWSARSGLVLLRESLVQLGPRFSWTLSIRFSCRSNGEDVHLSVD